MYQLKCVHWLETTVRQATDPDHPDLIACYLAALERQATTAECAEEKRQIYRRAYQTLLETICDSLIARHWRCSCLDAIHRPVLALQRLARTPADTTLIRQYYYEVARLSHYFLSSPDYTHEKEQR